MSRRNRRQFLVQPALAAVAPAFLSAAAEAKAPAGPFVLRFAKGRITGLRYRGDAFDTDYIAPGAALGDVTLRWRTAGGDWQAFSTAGMSGEAHGIRETRFVVTSADHPRLAVTIAWRVKGALLAWDITLENLGPDAVEIGDLALPLAMHTQFKADQPATAAVLKHSFVSGHGSFAFWMRSNSAGPFLVMTPNPDTAAEYWSHHGETAYSLYLHSAASAEAIAAEGGRWRLPHSNLILPAGGRRSYGFTFGWADGYDAVRDHLVALDGLDVKVAPGMTVPSDLFADIAIRSRQPVSSVEAEFPGETTLEALPGRAGHQVFRVRFARLGENRLSLHHGDGRVTWLEFFVTEPVETLIRKRGAFIAAHRHSDPAKWYNGLLAEWNMETGTLLGPDAYDRITGWRIYEVTCDDPGLSKPAFLALKNAEYPVAAEVAALDDYVEHFVWGGLQRTTAETYSYGIYGIPDWKQNRDSADPGPKGQQHIWRAYDYPHIIAMYFGLYRIARDRAVATRLDRLAYLERAYGTTIAMFTVPLETGNWSAYETGYYNEIVIPELIAALDAEGQADKADAVRALWERKIRTFVVDTPNLFSSEYAFDSTGFESTQALVRYASDRRRALRQPLSETAIRRFREHQMAANLFCRGVIEPAYYYLGSDYRAQGGDAYTLSYMAQMGGQAVLDYALNDADRPQDYLRIGYNSLLSSWALMNTGTPASNYGYWYPGAANDGGAGGGFEPAAYGQTWLGQPHHRGSWYYACEIDLGFCGALRGAATILSDDGVFGRFCYGGLWRRDGEVLRVTPRDGVRRRFHARLDRCSLSIHLDRDRFAGEVAFSEDLSRIAISVESDATALHTARVHLHGLPDGLYVVEEIRTPVMVVSRQLTLEVPVDGGSGAFTLTQHQPS